MANDKDKMAGWWNLSRLSGSRTGVAGAVQSGVGVPDYWKACLLEQLEAIPEEFNSVTLDAHCSVHGDTVNVNLSIRPSKTL